MAEKQENIDAADAKYNYRAPYQADCGTENRSKGGNCEKASGNLNDNLDHNTEDQNENYAKNEEFSEANIEVSPVSENDIVTRN